jgi:hypothetical protein
LIWSHILPRACCLNNDDDGDVTKRLHMNVTKAIRTAWIRQICPVIQDMHQLLISHGLLYDPSKFGETNVSQSFDDTASRDDL